MHISFQSITGQELQNFCNDVKAVLSIAVVEQFGIPENGEVITDAEVMEILHNPEATVYNIYANGEKAGGVALRINDVTHRNSMDLFYLYPEFHGRGLGYHAWKMIEGMYPETEDEEADCLEYIDNTDKIIYLYYQDDKCVGKVKLRKNWNRYAYIEDIAVCKDFRGQGIGSALINISIEWAKHKNLHGLMLETQDSRPPF